MTAIAQSYFMTQRHTRALLRQPWFVAITLIQPVIWLLLFGSLFRSVTEIPGFNSAATYLDYLVPGIIVMTALMSSGWSGMGVIEDIDRGLLDRFLAGPTHRSSLIVGRMATRRSRSSSRGRSWAAWRGCSVRSSRAGRSASPCSSRRPCSSPPSRRCRAPWR